MEAKPRIEGRFYLFVLLQGASSTSKRHIPNKSAHTHSDKRARSTVRLIYSDKSQAPGEKPILLLIRSHFLITADSVLSLLNRCSPPVILGESDVKMLIILVCLDALKHT